MKRFLFIFIWGLMCTQLSAQNTYQTSFKNSPDAKVEIRVGSAEMIIIGHNKSEIIIETDYVQKKGDDEMKKIETPPTDKEVPDRAKGLKPLSSTGIGNTNIGLTVEQSENHFAIGNISPKAVNNKYTIRIPDNASLTILDVQPMVESDFVVKNMKGEVNFTALNSNVVIENVSGPVVATATNGSVEIVYASLTPDKPNSITSVNGFVDITLPSTVKIDLNLNSVNGEAFTDFKIDVKSDMPSVTIPNFEMTVMEGKINGGGSPFSISTVNGDIYLRKNK